MAGKNKGGREVRKPKAAKVKNNASQPSTKGITELVAPAKNAVKNAVKRAGSK